MEGAIKLGITEKLAHHVFEQIVTFGGYGFNKSHSTAYGLVSYQTAFLKANYPVEFMAASLTSEIGHSAIGKEEDSKIVVFLNETESMGIKVLPPDVQKSFSGKFTIEKSSSPSASAVPLPSGEGAAKRRVRRLPDSLPGILAVKNVSARAPSSPSSRCADQSGGPFQSFEEFFQRVDVRQANRKVLESLVKAGAFDCVCRRRPHATRPRAAI